MTVFDGMVQCDWCEGMFFPDEMDGDHCAECSEQLLADWLAECDEDAERPA